uniref:Glycoside hydrolase family 43 n=1 Tax=Colletotrichum fructicola (strain Nara gc5) TaxID=1213859 RepID=L2G1B1_COLFN
MPTVRNPILPGFNPDPSIVRVGDDYYIATSTFEWFPGVQIHHSKDLANWTLATRPLTRKSQLDMRGAARKDGSYKDTHNYIVTAPAIEGPWSDPYYINSSGFDPSLFHDDDGRKWFVNMMWDHRRRPHAFTGIVLQEFDPKQGKLVGPKKNIFRGTELALGGPAYEHACTLARSRDIWGPYELHPQKYVITSKDSPFAALQRAGHGDIVDTPEGKTYMVHLSGRPTTQKRRCVLGRETALQEAYWADDDWLYVKNGPVPSLHVEVPGTPDETAYWAEKKISNGSAERIFRTEGGKLTLIGRESVGSWFEQALVARRQTHFSYDAETVVSFFPTDEREFAGLTAYYCRYNFFYLTVTAHSDGKRELLIQSSEASWPDGNLTEPFVDPVPLPDAGKVKLALTIRGPALQFYYALEGEELKKIGPVFDASLISDECGGHQAHGSFTGAFVGVAASDCNGTAREATFDYFVYRPVRDETDRYEI